MNKKWNSICFTFELIKDTTYSTNDLIIGQMEIHSDSMSFTDRYEDSESCTTEGMLSKAFDLYKQG